MSKRRQPGHLFSHRDRGGKPPHLFTDDPPKDGKDIGEGGGKAHPRTHFSL